MERKGGGQQRTTQLPGENGFHARDGSLTKKKREQWEKEKAEAEKHSWFPFGRKSLANKKSIIKEKEQRNGEDVDAEKSRMEGESAIKIEQQLAMNSMDSAWNSLATERQTVVSHETFNISGPFPIPPSPQIQSPYPLQPMHISNNPPNPSPFLPIYMEYPPPLPTPQLFHPLPNLFPIQTAQQQFAPFSPYPMPISLAAPTPATFLDPIFLPQKVPFTLLPTPPFSGSSSSGSANSPPKEASKEMAGKEEFGQNEGLDSTQMTSIRWQEELNKQLAEKRMAEEMAMEKRMNEQKRLEKEEIEKRRREEEERTAEEKRRTQKIEIRDEHEKAYLNGIQRAQKEAELLKKAKLFRHILENGDADIETAKDVLKTDDGKMVKEVLKQLRELEFQRQIAAENISFNSAQRPTKSPATPQNSEGIKEKGSGEKKVYTPQSGPFQRAKTWSAKQSRTIPSPSMLPVPVRLKQQFAKEQKQKAETENGKRNLMTKGPLTTTKMQIAINGKAPIQTASSKLSTPSPHQFIAPKPPTGKNNNKEKSTEKNNNNNKNSTSGRLSGLFEQLTLRRPRLSGSFGAKETRRMTLSGGQNARENVAVDLNGNNMEAEKNARANAVDLDRLNSNAPSNNSTNSAPSTQANSPTSSSIETASVVKFRALLSSPTNSQEDLSADFPPLPPPRMSLGGAKARNGPFLVPQSPFSRKNSANEGNKDCFGEQELRRSLRSPTMRRFQESNQSLATIEGTSDGGQDSRSSTPRPFNCRNPQYRSFNMRKDIARQNQIMENLKSVREQLKTSQAQLERTLSKQNLAATEQYGNKKNGERDAFL